MPRPKTDISFKAFWDAYGYKRDRIGARQAWDKLTDRLKRAALAGIPSYRGECHRTGIAMMHPARYLRHRRWEDELSDSSCAPDVHDADVLADMDVW